MHKNNFDFLRLFLAIFIITAHSHVLVKDKSFFYSSEYGIDFAYLRVRSFFIISGFLVFRSFLRSADFINFLWKRILRIYPALIFCLIITLLILPFVYDSSTTPYVSNKFVWSYIPRNLSLLFLQYEIPGIFENNPFPKVINGSLWTLRYEFFFYLFLVLLFIVKSKKKIIIVILLTSFVINYFLFFYYLNNHPTPIKLHFTELSLSFISGCLFAVFNFQKITTKINRTIFFISLVVLILNMLYFSYLFTYTRYFILPFFIISFGQMSIYPLTLISNTVGDLSYGIYISAFPIQQILLHYYHLSSYELSLITIIFSSIYALISWNVVEKRFIKYKDSLPTFINKLKKSFF